MTEPWTYLGVTFGDPWFLALLPLAVLIVRSGNWMQGLMLYALAGLLSLLLLTLLQMCGATGSTSAARDLMRQLTDKSKREPSSSPSSSSRSRDISFQVTTPGTGYRRGDQVYYVAIPSPSPRR